MFHNHCGLALDGVVIFFLEGITGFTFNIMQFISERIEETLTGTTATVVVKIFGPDLDVLQSKGTEVRNITAGIPGVTDLTLEQQTGVPKLLIQFRRDAMAGHGLNSAEVERATRLIHELAARGITIVMIEHLMKVVLNVCTRIVVLHNGALIADGAPREVISNPAVVEAYLGQQYARRSAGHG